MAAVEHARSAQPVFGFADEVLASTSLEPRAASCLEILATPGAILKLKRKVGGRKIRWGSSRAQARGAEAAAASR